MDSGWRELVVRTTDSGDGSTVLSPTMPSMRTTTESSRSVRCTVAAVPSSAPGLRMAMRAPSPQP